MRVSSFITCLSFATAVLAKPTVYLIRHGEKPDDGGNGLSATGLQRAQCLRQVFSGGSQYGITHIMAQTPKSGAIVLKNYVASSANFRQMARGSDHMNTVKPLADDLGLTVDTSCDRDDPKCVEDVVKGYTASGNILICWEHDALSDIVDELGAKKSNVPTYPDDR